jgi:hypothetical protein
MTAARPIDTRDDRIREVLAELQATISRQYPDARFTVSHPEDEPTSVELTAIVDVDDPDEVLDMVIDRVIDLQVDEGLPIHVVPIRTPERVAADHKRTNRRGDRARRRLLLADAGHRAGTGTDQA